MRLYRICHRHQEYSKTLHTCVWYQRLSQLVCDEVAGNKCVYHKHVLLWFTYRLVISLRPHSPHKHIPATLWFLHQIGSSPDPECACPPYILLHSAEALLMCMGCCTSSKAANVL